MHGHTKFAPQTVVYNKVCSMIMILLVYSTLFGKLEKLCFVMILNKNLALLAAILMASYNIFTNRMNEKTHTHIYIHMTF